GIEALSRGAARATFVERDQGAIRAIRENLRRVGFPAGPAVEVVEAEALRWLRRPAGVGPFDVVVIDPPYADTALLTDALSALGDPAAGLLAPDAHVVAKHFWRDAPPDRIGLLASERSRRFGETALTFYRFGVGEP
ncbi:MAG: rRNA (guanine966-N2)-methyltransferase, partial [Chloroflexota bacterium]|nr:rRNA (guanine966-N2)-methyltransferase [Chloroflexota bacterium]